MRGEEAASSNGQDAALSRLRWEFDSPRCYQVMSTQTIELDGFEIEVASELYCDRNGDHHERRLAWTWSLVLIAARANRKISVIVKKCRLVANARTGIAGLCGAP